MTASDNRQNGQRLTCENAIARAALTETALQRIQWAYETLHFSQAAFIKRLIELPLSDFLGDQRSASTVKSYLQGNLPKGTPDLLEKLTEAVACFFNVPEADFYDSHLAKTEFCAKIRHVDGRQKQELQMLQTENEKLRTEIAALEEQLGTNPISAPVVSPPNDDSTGGGIEPLPDEQVEGSKPKGSLTPLLLVLIAGLILVGGIIGWGYSVKPQPYPPRSVAEIRYATIDGRDLRLNTPSTPMLVAYGSSLCLSLGNDTLFASAFIEDRGFFFNQEGRLLICPGDQGERCTGLWPGTADAFHKTPYKLYISVSPQRLPVTGDSDRREDLPPGDYFGPIYLQRRE
jgi:hypothetical protein